MSAALSRNRCLSLPRAPPGWRRTPTAFISPLAHSLPLFRSLSRASAVAIARFAEARNRPLPVSFAAALSRFLRTREPLYSLTVCPSLFLPGCEEPSSSPLFLSGRRCSPAPAVSAAPRHLCPRRQASSRPHRARGTAGSHLSPSLSFSPSPLLLLPLLCSLPVSRRATAFPPSIQLPSAELLSGCVRLAVPPRVLLSAHAARRTTTALARTTPWHADRHQIQCGLCACGHQVARSGWPIYLFLFLMIYLIHRNSF